MSQLLVAVIKCTHSNSQNKRIWLVKHSHFSGVRAKRFNL